MSNAHRNNDGEMHLTVAQQRHLHVISRILPELPSHIAAQAAKDTEGIRSQFVDKSAYWSLVIDHATRLHEAEVSMPFFNAARSAHHASRGKPTPNVFPHHQLPKFRRN